MLRPWIMMPDSSPRQRSEYPRRVPRTLARHSSLEACSAHHGTPRFAGQVSILASIVEISGVGKSIVPPERIFEAAGEGSVRKLVAHAATAALSPEYSARCQLRKISLRSRRADPV